jgi:hypothetical protein
MNIESQLGISIHSSKILILNSSCIFVFFAKFLLQKYDNNIDNQSEKTDFHSNGKDLNTLFMKK